MKRTTQIGKLSLALSLLLVTGFFVEARSQSLPECNAKLEIAKEAIRTQDQQIEKLNDQVQNRVAKVEALQEKVDALNDLIAELRKQVELTAENNKTLKDSLELRQAIMDSRQQAITDRDLLIKELVKSNKRSTLQRLADSLPSLASIIAIAITAR